MVQIVLNNEQARRLAESDDTVVFVDPEGHVLATLDGTFSPEEVQAAERRAGSRGPWHSTDEVIAHLRSLERGA